MPCWPSPRAISTGPGRRLRRPSTFTRRTGELFGGSRLEYVLRMIADLDGDPATAYRHIERSLRLSTGSASTRRSPPRPACWCRWPPGWATPGWPCSGARSSRAVVRGGRTSTARDGRGAEPFGLRARAHRQLARAAAAHRAARDWYLWRGSRRRRTVRVSLGFVAPDRRDEASATRHHRGALDAAAEIKDDAVSRSRWRARPGSRRGPATRLVPPSCWARRGTEPGRHGRGDRRCIVATSTMWRNASRATSAPSISPG